jgi:hypothetical protein
MISAWHLVWIVPVAMMAGVIATAIVAANKR